MGKSAPQAPAPPDYVGAAQAQGVANINTAQAQASLNNPNVTNPYGSQQVTYTPTGPNGDQQANVTQTLNPTSQQTLNAQQGVQLGEANLAKTGLNTAQGIMGTPFQFSGPGINTSLNTSGVAAMPVNAGTTGQQAIMSRLQPEIDQQSQATQQRLANQGITPGSEAYNNEMRNQSNQQNDAYQQAALQGINLDMSANNQGYNQALQTGQYQNTASNQALQQQLGLYNQPLNEITSLMSGSQIQSPQFQQYSGGGTIAPAPLANATAQAGNFAQQNYANQVAAYNSGQSGLFGLLGAGVQAAGMFA